MTNKELLELTKDKQLPCNATNADGEFVIIEAGCTDGERYFRLTTAQHNNWCRINIIYENGSTEEWFEK